LRELRRVLESGGQALAFALDGALGIGVEAREDEPRGQPDDDQHNKDLRQREPRRAADAASRRA